VHMSLALHCVSAVRGLKHHSFCASFCALGGMLKGSEERKGGGCRQREKKRKLEANVHLQQSSLAKYLVLKPPPLDTPSPTK
jgi:hypothetical protein